MRSITRAAAFLLLAAALGLGACKTKPPVPAEPPAPAAEPAAEAPKPAEPAPIPEIKVETSAFRAESGGFWPAAESRRKLIEFSLLFGNAALVGSWRVEIAPAAQGAGPGPAAAAKVFSGSGAELPASLSWDGMKDSGEAAAEGLYLARLSIGYGEALPPVSLESQRFVLARSAPEPLLSAEPPRFEPSVEGVQAPVGLELGAKPGLARIAAWSLEILGPDGSPFRSFAGEWPAPRISWDGRSASGGMVEPGKRYTAVLELSDEYGHAAAARLPIAVSPLPFATERSSVTPWTSGFSPNGDKAMDRMDFSLGFGNREAVAAWKLEILAATGPALRSWSGAGPAAGGSLPESLTWEGLDAAGKSAPEGRYTALLSLDYGKRFAAESARSPSFVLDVSPPAVKAAVSPELFSPDGDGTGDLARFSLSADSGLARVVDWSVDIYGAERGLFARLAGPWPAAGASWDGRGSGGELVDSAETYPFVARARDEFGNVGQAEGSISTDILAVKEGERYRISVTSIVFKGFTADYRDLPPELARQNLYTLDRLAEKFARFPGYRIELVGHAVMLNWDDPVKGEAEQRDILIPLSNARAKAIAAALRERGIEIERLRTEGAGAVAPVVPHSDVLNRWKNRRVDFYLERK